MILPATTLASLLLLILTLLCWGSWANTQKLVYKWRFELFYYDFALGVAFCVLLAVYLFGSANSQELTVSDNIFIAGYRKMAFAAAAGVVVNLATILLVAAISICGMTVAFPLAFGVGLIVLSLNNYIGNTAGDNAALLFGGIALILGAVIADIVAYRTHVFQLAARARAQDPAGRIPSRPPRTAIGVILGTVSGIAWGFFFPLIDSSRSGDNGVGPYGLAGLVGAGVLISTLLYGPFFFNFPIQGQPVQGRNYFTGTKKQHFWGFFGGIIWGVGLVAALVEAAAPTPARTPAGLATGLVYSAPLLATLWGMFAWREFRSTASNVKLLHLVMLLFFLLGVTLLSLAPVYAAK